MGDSNHAIKKLVIVGGGTAGWMVAALAGKLMGRQLTIELVESDQIGTVGVGEATIPPIQVFNKAVGIDENAFLRATQGTIKLGIEFKNWGNAGDSYMHAFGPVGRRLGMVPFHHYWLRAQASGDSSDLWQYSFNQQAAFAGKFDRMAKIPGSPLDGLAHAFHFDAGLYAQFLRAGCKNFGIKRTEGLIEAVHQDNETGYVTSVELKDGTNIEGDLFVDCTGFRGLLIEQTLETGYEDWSHYLPCDRALAVPSENIEPPRPYTQSIAHTAGWQWRIPLQHRTGNGHVYCSDFMSDDEATAILLENLEGKNLRDPIKIPFKTGRRKKFWNKNVVAIGLSSGFLEPLESTSIHLIQQSLVRLMRMFPTSRFDQSNVDEYNKQVGFEFDVIRDFIILHYHVNKRTDSPFWKHCAAMNIPESLKHRLRLFQDTGRVFRFNNELFAEPAWLQVLIGQGIKPTSYSPMAQDIDDTELAGFFSDLKTIMAGGLAQLPSHADFIDRHCKARAD